MLLWIDIETTGLNVTQDIPLEVGFILTHDNYTAMGEVARMNWICKVHNWDFEPHDPFVHDMHTKSGLLDLLRRSNTEYQSYHAIDLQMMDWLQSQAYGFLGLDGTYPSLHPAGSSVHFDRTFLKKYFPLVESLLHHRHLDVSSVKMLYPFVGLEYHKEPEDPHRALADLDLDIAWLNKFVQKAAAFFPKGET